MIQDIEGLSIIEAIRQVGLEKNPEDVLYVHVTLLPYISGSNEVKSKPTQHSVMPLLSGICKFVTEGWLVRNQTRAWETKMEFSDHYGAET